MLKHTLPDKCLGSLEKKLFTILLKTINVKVCLSMFEITFVILCQHIIFLLEKHIF